MPQTLVPDLLPLIALFALPLLFALFVPPWLGLLVAVALALNPLIYLLVEEKMKASRDRDPYRYHPLSPALFPEAPSDVKPKVPGSAKQKVSSDKPLYPPKIVPIYRHDLASENTPGRLRGDARHPKSL